MAMRKSIGHELRMLREIANQFLIQHTCILCKLSLLTPAETTVKLGHQAPKPIKSKFTIHHVDGDHENNDPGNRAVVHRDCHKRWHLKDFRAKGTIERSAATNRDKVIEFLNGANRLRSPAESTLLCKLEEGLYLSQRDKKLIQSLLAERRTYNRRTYGTKSGRGHHHGKKGV